MQNYHSYDVEPFIVTQAEIDKLAGWVVDESRIQSNLQYLRNKYGNGLLRYEQKDIPKNLKRNNSDSATLLVMYFANGRILAKRHNNSQWLKL